MKEDISQEIDTIIQWCRNMECDDCKYFFNEKWCALHNPSTWEA